MTSRKPRAIDDLSSIEKTKQDYFFQDIEQEEGFYNNKPVRKNFLERLKIFKIFIISLFLLLLLNLYLWGETLISRLFLLHNTLGWLSLFLGCFAIGSFVIWCLRECLFIYRLENVEHIRRQAQKAFIENDSSKAKKAVIMLLNLTETRALTQTKPSLRGRVENTIMNTREMLSFAENEVLNPLDKKAKQNILASAKRLSLMSALTPRLLIELPYIIFETIRLIRNISLIYGCRVGKIGLLTILRRILLHLSLTSGLSLSDNFFQNLIGQNIATRISTRLGEGLVNGFMITRIGIAAMESLRPFPFLENKRPKLSDFAAELIKSKESQTEEKQ